MCCVRIHRWVIVTKRGGSPGQAAGKASPGGVSVSLYTANPRAERRPEQLDRLCTVIPQPRRGGAGGSVEVPPGGEPLEGYVSRARTHRWVIRTKRGGSPRRAVGEASLECV